MGGTAYDELREYNRKIMYSQYSTARNWNSRTTFLNICFIFLVRATSDQWLSFVCGVGEIPRRRHYPATGRAGCDFFGGRLI